VGHKPQIHRREIVVRGQSCDQRLFGLANQLPVAAHEATYSRLPKDLRFVGLPPQQPGHRDEGQLLRQQASPFLEAAGNNDAMVEWKDGVEWEDVGRGVALLADLARQRQDAEAAGDGDHLVAIGSHRLPGTVLAMRCEKRRIDDVPLGALGNSTPAL